MFLMFRVIAGHKEENMQIEKLVLGICATNCYIVYDDKTKKAIVIDPADSFDKIKNKINMLGVEVEYIIITHAHIDHIMALDDLKGYTNAKIVINANEAPFLNDAVNNLANHFSACSPKSKPDVLINDGDNITLENMVLKFIHTPGHTSGGMCILIGDDLFSGDTLFNMSIGRTDFYGGNFEYEINSIKNKLLPLGDNIKVYPGHGESTTIGFEKRNNMFLM